MRRETTQTDGAPARAALFTMVEMLIVVMVVTILAATLMPTLAEAKKHAKFTRWLAFNRTCSSEPECALNFNFQDGYGTDYVLNSAAGSTIRNESNNMYDGRAYKLNGATLTAAETKTLWGKSGRWGRWKRAVTFNGDRVVKIPAYNVGRFDPTETSFTVYAWAKFDQGRFETGRTLFSKANWGTATYSSAICDIYARTPSGDKKELCVDNFTDCSYWDAAPAGFDINGWNQIGMRYNARTGVMDGFVNGKLIGSLTTYADTERNSTNAVATDWQRSLKVPFLLGGVHRQTSEGGAVSIPSAFAFYGLMDEFVIYHKPLTDSELRAHYAMGKE